MWPPEGHLNSITYLPFETMHFSCPVSNGDISTAKRKIMSSNPICHLLGRSVYQPGQDVLVGSAGRYPTQSKPEGESSTVPPDSASGLFRCRRDRGNSYGEVLSLSVPGKRSDPHKHARFSANPTRSDSHKHARFSANPTTSSNTTTE